LNFKEISDFSLIKELCLDLISVEQFDYANLICQKVQVAIESSEELTESIKSLYADIVDLHLELGNIEQAKGIFTNLRELGTANEILAKRLDLLDHFFKENDKIEGLNN
jgi:hypothetical protein